MDVYSACLLDGNTLPMAFIRFNPDVCRLNGDVVKMKKKERHERLVHTIQNWVFGPPGSVQVLYMWYDGTRDAAEGAVTLDIWGDEEYNLSWLECCSAPVY